MTNLFLGEGIETALLVNCETPEGEVKQVNLLDEQADRKLFGKLTQSRFEELNTHIVSAEVKIRGRNADNPVRLACKKGRALVSNSIHDDSVDTHS